MAAWKYLSSLRWAMVVKIDAAEAFAPIVKRRNAVLIVGGITLLLVVGALVVARSISNPIVSLTRVVRFIAGHHRPDGHPAGGRRGRLAHVQRRGQNNEG